MMKWLVSSALRLRVAVVVLTAVLLIVGTRIVSQTRFDVFPEFAPPLVEVQTEVPGLSSSEVEVLVTVPIENALNGVSWLKEVRSKSVLGLSSVVLFFEEGTDIMEARQLVQERLTQLAERLPDVAKPPVILSPLSSTSRVLKIGMSSEKLSQMEITTIAKWTIRPRLMAIPGVANVAIWGQRDRQIQVLVDPNHLYTHEVTTKDVVRATQEAVEIGGGGFIDTPNQKLPVAHTLSIQRPEDLADVPIAIHNGAPLKLGDLADLVEGFPPPIGDAVINDGPGILLIVEKQPWGNTLEVTRKIEEVLEALRPGLKDIDIDSTIFRPATFIEMSLSNLNRALLIGCVLVICVLVFFLNNWRTALISALAIPTSLIIAAIILNYRGGTINTMVLAGLIIALGVLVLMPVLFLRGLSGSFFRPLALSCILAILSSLLVAVILTPALSMLLLPQAVEQRESPLLVWLKARYEVILPKLMNNPRKVLPITAIALVLALVTIPFLGEEFLPHFKEYDFLMHWVEKPGTSLQAMERITIRVSKELRSIPGVRNFGPLCFFAHWYLFNPVHRLWIFQTGFIGAYRIAVCSNRRCVFCRRNWGNDFTRISYRFCDGVRCSCEK